MSQEGGLPNRQVTEELLQYFGSDDYPARPRSHLCVYGEVPKVSDQNERPARSTVLFE